MSASSSDHRRDLARRGVCPDCEEAYARLALLESVGLEPTRAGRRIQLPPKQTSAWLEWIGEPVPGVEYKWAVDVGEYRETKRDAEA